MRCRASPSVGTSPEPLGERAEERVELLVDAREPAPALEQVIHVDDGGASGERGDLRGERRLP